MEKKPFKRLTSMLRKDEAKVFIIRHGHTNLNGTSDTSVDRIRGWINVPLNDLGRKDAQDAGNKLLKEHPTKIYASDLIRAVETAEIIDKNFNVPIIKDMKLRPWNLGDFNGQKTDDVKKEMDHMVRDENIIAPNGESFKQFRIRYLTELHRIINEAIEKNITIFVVAHLRNLKTFQGWEAKDFPADLSIDASSMIKDMEEPGAVVQVDLKKYQKKEK